MEMMNIMDFQSEHNLLETGQNPKDKNAKESKRVKMTKQLLKNSLLEILKTQNIHQISIRELCKNAEINRSTFYKHYGSQYDLLKDMETEVLSQIDKEISQGNITYDISRLTSLLTYCTNNLELCKLLFNSNVDPDFPKKVIYMSSIQNILDQHISNDNSNEKKYIYDYIVYGGYNILVQWINNDNRESPEEIAKLLAKIILNFLHSQEKEL